MLVEIRTSKTSKAAVNRLRALGARVVNVSSAYATVTASVKPSALAGIAADASVRYVSEVLAPRVGAMATTRRRSGATPGVCAPVVSEGDGQMNVAAARTNNSIDGAGQTIGIMSDSFNTDTTASTHAADDVASGTLPGAGNPCGETSPVVVQADSSSGGHLDEGRAMAQLAHGLAPGAHLAFATANNGDLDFASQITKLRTVNRASVLVDDVSYINEPFFQDGPIANAANAASAAGVPYFSAAGNSNVEVGGNNVSSYEAPALRSVACPAGVTAIEPLLGCHNFDTTGGTDTGDDITLAPGGGFALDLQWAQPWGAVSADYDLFIVNASGTVVGGSGSDNLASQRPYEFAGYQNTTGSPQTVHIVIGKYAGGNARLKFVLMGASGITAIQYNTSTGGDIVGPSIFGHNGTSTVAGTAAIPYNDSTSSENFSSHGPVTLYYQPTPSTASLGAPQVVNQPAFAATDGVQTSFFGELNSGVWRFYGTSAAAPQAAAIGALLQEKDAALSPAELIATMSSTARSVATDGSADAVGGGYLDADAALASVTALPGAPTAVTAVNGNAQAAVQWNAPASDPNFPITGYSVTPIRGGVPQPPQVFNSTATSQPVTGLTNGASYTFTIIATNANGNGPSSQPCTATTVGAPGPPTSVTAAPGNGQANVAWVAPTATNGSAVTGYTITPFLSGVAQSPQTFPSPSAAETVNGLANGNGFTFAVAAINANGTGPSSTPSAVATVGTPTPPAPPMLTPVNSGMQVSWGDATPNGSPIQHYYVLGYVNGTDLFANVALYSTDHADKFIALDNGTAYAFRVSASNANGTGPASGFSALVIAGTPTAPPTPSAVAHNASATVTWHASASTNGSPITNYVVTPYLSGIALTPRTYAANATKVTITGLKSGSRYAFRVAAKNARGIGPPSVPSVAITIGTPTAPRNVTAKAGHKSARVHWTAPANNGGAAITRYVITPFKNGKAQTARSYAATATTETVKGLTAGQYAFTVTATNSRGTSTPSTATTKVTVT